MSRFREEIEMHARQTASRDGAQIEAAALQLGYPDRESARLGRVGAMAVAVLWRTRRQSMSFGEVQADLIREMDICASVVLDRALVAADAAKVLTYDPGARRVSWPVDF